MARIRSIKPEFFRHEGLQELEVKYPTYYPMIVFSGLWLQCDKLGHFLWKPTHLHLDILPFIDFNIEHTLYILEAYGFLRRYSIEGKEYGEVIKFTEHQRITGTEYKNDARFPLPNDFINGITKETLRNLLGNTTENKETSGKQQGNIDYEGETSGKQQGNIEDYGRGEGRGKGKGKRKGVVGIVQKSATANIFEVFERNYQAITQETRDILLDFIDTYSEDKVLYALNEGIVHNARNISYIEAILKGKTNGIKPAKETDEEKKVRREAWKKERGID